MQPPSSHRPPASSTPACPTVGCPSCHDEAVVAIQDLLRPGTLVLAPWTADGHPDHDAAGRAAAQAVASTPRSHDGPVGLAHYLVWLWHWGDPDDLPWAESVVVDATLDGMSKGERALAEHRSQRLRLSRRQRATSRCSPHAVLAPSRRGFTTLVLGGRGRCAGDRNWHSDAGISGPDLRRDVRRRRRPVVEPELVRTPQARPHPRRAPPRTLRQGARPRLLDGRAHHGARRSCRRRRGASTRARARWTSPGAVGHRASPGSTGGRPTSCESSRAPSTSSCSRRSAYFLRPFDLWLTLAAVLSTLVPGGELLLVHWRHPTKHIPSDGPTVHAQVRAVCERWATVSHVEPDLLLDGYVVPRDDQRGPCRHPGTRRGAAAAAVPRQRRTGPGRPASSEARPARSTSPSSSTGAAIARHWSWRQPGCTATTVDFGMVGATRDAGVRWALDVQRPATASRRTTSGSPAPMPTPSCPRTGSRSRSSWLRPTTPSSAPSSRSASRTPTC